MLPVVLGARWVVKVRKAGHNSKTCANPWKNRIWKWNFRSLIFTGGSLVPGSWGLPTSVSAGRPALIAPVLRDFQSGLHRIVRHNPVPMLLCLCYLTGLKPSQKNPRFALVQHSSAICDSLRYGQRECATSLNTSGPLSIDLVTSLLTDQSFGILPLFYPVLLLQIQNQVFPLLAMKNKVLPSLPHSVLLRLGLLSQT